MESYKSKAQEVVNLFGSNFWEWMMRGIALLLVVVGLYWIYAYRQFRGLKDANAIECAQLAHRISTGRGFTTGMIRPLDIWFLDKHGIGKIDADRFPDIRHAPVYPYLTALGFKIAKPSFEVKSGGVIFDPEKKVVLPIGVFFSIATGLLLYLLARLLFSEAVAVAAVFIYFLSDVTLAWSVSGTLVPVAMFFVTATFYFTSLAVVWRNRDRSALWWGMSLGICSIAAGLAFLTMYSLIVVVPPVLMMLWRAFGKDRLVVMGCFLMIFSLLVMPWMLRNKVVCGAFLGTAPYAVLNNSNISDHDTIERSVTPRIDSARVLNTLRAKFIPNIVNIIDLNIKTMGNGLIICFFIVSLFYALGENDSLLSIWYVALGIFLLLLIVALDGLDGNRIDVFLPLVIIYGTAFLFINLGTGDYIPADRPVLFAWVIVILTAVPLVFRIVGPRAGIPYPPYYPPFVSYVSSMLDKDEVMCSDIPEAVAWYGNKSAVLLPATDDDFMSIYKTMPVKGLYLTSKTGDKPYLSALCNGRFKDWFPVLCKKVKDNFPLTQGLELPPGEHDQIFLTDRVRW